MKTQATAFMGVITLAMMIAAGGSAGAVESAAYACEDDLIEIMFEPQAQVRLRGEGPVDIGSAKGLTGVDGVLSKLAWHEWERACPVPEARLDAICAEGEARTQESIYNLNNIWRLRILPGEDIWSLCRELEDLPGIMTARPVPMPVPLPTPPSYVDSQHYLDPASATPTGIDAEYSWLSTWGYNATVCDIEYSWDIYHGDLPYAYGYPINTNTADPFGDLRHGTAVLGILASQHNSFGTSGICAGATIKTCGSFYGTPTPSWNVPGAIAIAIDSLCPGDVILLEQQWDYNDPNTPHTDYVPIEWWVNTYPGNQTNNAVYAAIRNATAIGIHVIECGGNGGAPTLNSGYDTDNLTWYGNSGAIIVGAGGAYAGGTYVEGDLERLSYSSYGGRYDLQGWGENVVTTAYGDLWSEIQGAYNYNYTADFGGTSGGGAVVAGAVAQCMAYWNSYVSPSVPTTEFIRDLLVTTGTPQINPGSGHIGPRPNLQAAFAQLKNAWSWVVDSTPPLNVGGAYGVSWADYDRDGDNDLYVTSYNWGSWLVRNDGGGTWSSPFGSGTAPNDYQHGTGSAWGDYDNDGDLDLYLGQGNGQPNKLFQNNGDGTFANVTAGPLGGSDTTIGVSWVDYDLDGDLDLYLANYRTANKLLRNDAGWFTDVSSAPLNYTGRSVGAAWADYDDDGDQDVYVVNQSEGNLLIRNDGGGNFTDVTYGNLGDPWLTAGAAWGDYDNDGDLDLFFATNTQYHANRLMRNDGGGVFVDVTSIPMGDSAESDWGVAWGDYDNDADLDLFVTNSSFTEDNKLWRNNGSGVFSDVAMYYLAAMASCYGTAFGDCDGDGDLDLYNCQSPSRLLCNAIGSANHWFHVDLVGNGGSNRDAIGARVRIVHNGRSQIREVNGGSGWCSMNSLTVEFGLGLDTMVDSLIIRWPRVGKNPVTVYTNLLADQTMTIYEVPPFVCGDADGNGVGPDIADLVYLVNYMFNGGSAPPNMTAVDVNGSGSGPDIADLVYLVNYMFSGGPAPACP